MNLGPKPAILIFACSVAIHAGAADSVRLSVQHLYWLAGCWHIQDAEPGSGEQWTPPAGGIMIGTARLVRDGKTTGHEFLLIRETRDGSLEYVASPSGQTETAFRLSSISENEVVFQNLEHDFPQRIIYRLVGETNLKARTEGKVDGELKAIDFPMQKIDCETGEPAVHCAESACAGGE